MKILLISFFAIALIFSSCQSSSSSNNAKESEVEADAMTGKDLPEMNMDSKKSSIDGLVQGYLTIKNALTKDNSKDAANAGKELVTTIEGIDQSSFTALEKKAFVEVIDDTRENAEHIGDNSGKLEHQREHFAMLSKDVDDLIKAFGTSHKLYQDYCPMYDDGKGAIWISETKDIKNPYYGSKMLGCGKLQTEL